MSRSCVSCGAEFTESFEAFNRGLTGFDKIPECWRGDKENGHCINCCSCYKK